MRKSLNKRTDSARQMLRPLTARADTNQNTAAESAVLKKAKQNIYWQAALAMMTIVLTLVIIFAMSAAWYTNIVQTNGLLIRAESWGFDGDIKVNSTAITAAPGDEGLIHLVKSWNLCVGINLIGVGVFLHEGLLDNTLTHFFFKAVWVICAVVGCTPEQLH